MKEYKLTFQDFTEKQSYLKFKFDNDSDCLTFINTYNSKMDNVKIVDCKLTIFTYNGIKPKPVKPIQYKLMYKPKNQPNNRVLIKGDSDIKLVSVLRACGFKIESLIKSIKESI